MPEVNPEERIKSNVEVNIGISAGMAVQEARRCLDCADPECMKGCPVGVDIPGFIKYVEAGEFLKAAAFIKKNNVFPSICGRVCPQEVQCEARCLYGVKMKKEPVAIGYLERFVADYENQSGSVYKPEIAPAKNIKGCRNRIRPGRTCCCRRFG